MFILCVVRRFRVKILAVKRRTIALLLPPFLATYSSTHWILELDLDIWSRTWAVDDDQAGIEGVSSVG